MSTSSSLWQPFKLGRVELPHRLAMAPLTRSRANADGTPGLLAATYYGQRASLGLVITEGTQPSADGQGYPNTPGIHTPEQIAGWREVADAVHAGGGTLFIQLMHVGRMSHPDNTPHRRRPGAPSAISADQDIFTATGPKKTGPARAEHAGHPAVGAVDLHPVRAGGYRGGGGVTAPASSSRSPERWPRRSARTGSASACPPRCRWAGSTRATPRPSAPSTATWSASWCP